MPLGAIRWELRAKNKLCFIDRLLKKPDLSSLDFGLWEMCNSMIVSWLYNSLDKGLQEGLAYMDDAYEMWNELKEQFFQGNAHRVHQSKKEISCLEQGGEKVVTYYTKLKSL